MNKTQSMNLWPNRDVLIVCEDTDYYTMIREILRPLKWAVQMPASDIATARERLLSKAFGSIVIVESRKIPAPDALRTLYKLDRGRLTPTLVLTSFDETLDLQILQKVFSIVVSSKPLIPVNFMSAFREMTSHWEQPAMHGLRQLALLTSDQETDSVKMSILEKLSSDIHAAPYAIHVLLLIMMRQSQYREAEKKLLEFFRNSPGNLAILAQCAWFYLDSKAPHYALKFLNKIKSVAPSSVVLNFDIACAHIACGHLHQALIALQEWNNRFPGNQMIESYIARLLVAEGRTHSAALAGIPQNLIKRAKEAWDSSDKLTGLSLNQDASRMKAS
jgi:hypothetical protein